MPKISLPNKKSSSSTQPKYNPDLYGRDPEEGIVAVEPLQDEAMVEIFKRDKGRLTSRYEPSKSYFWTNSEEPLLDDIWDDGTEIYELEGDLHFDTLVETNSMRTAWWFRKHCKKGNCYMIRERGQYLLETGKTLFKGMQFDDVKRLYFDIETYTTPGYNFTNPQRPGDKTLIIAVKTNGKRNNKICIALNEDGWANPIVRARLETENPDVTYIFADTEEELLESFFVVVNHFDPDVLANHNIYNFDLWFLHERCQLLDIRLELGRGRTRPNTYDTSVYFGENSRDITCFEFYGRHVIDTEILARQDDAVKRKYDNYRLKYLVKEIGEEREDRIIIPGGRLAAAWDNKDPEFDRYDMLSYAVDDAVDAQKLDRAFGRAVFKSTQFTPYPYQDVFRLASGGKSETLFVRHYLENAHSLSKPEKRRKFPGGYAGVAKYGFIDEETVLLDYDSLYPTLGIEKGISPKNDVLNFYQRIIKLFREYRYDIKFKIKDIEDDELKKQLKSTDGAIKIYLNTIAYGYITSPFSLFNDYDEGTRITEEGQKELKKMISFVENDGGITTKFDTDGALFIPPIGYRGSKERNEEYAEYVGEHMTKGFGIGLDGRYQTALVIDGKSYALKDHNGKYTIKGDTLKSRRKEHFILEHLETVVKGILDGNLDILEESYFHWLNKIKNKELTKKDISQYANIKEPMETYETKVELGPGNGGRNPSAGYEIALKKHRSGTEIKVGDRIEYYVAESPMTLVIDGRTGKPKKKEKYSRVCDLAKDIDEFTPESINVDHYIDRLASSSEPIYMLFYEIETLREKFGMKMYKKRRDKLEEIGDSIYNDFIE